MAKVVLRRGFTFRKLADTSRGRLHDANGAPMGPWPTLGYSFMEPPPVYAVIPEARLLELYREGVAELENVEQVLRPAGPPHAPWAGKAGLPGQNHLFVHATKVTFHMVDGDYVYDVDENPDKAHVNRVATGGDLEGGTVSHDYLLNLASAPEGAATFENPSVEMPDTAGPHTRIVGKSPFDG